MGNSSYDAATFRSYTTTATAGKSTAQVFTARQLPKAFDPMSFAVRESRDSAANPNSTAIILGCDVTGSMGMVADEMIRSKLDLLIREIHERRPVTDPHVMVMAIGDTFSDSAPLQMTQFEPDVALAKQLTEIYLEGNGGGNGGESYLAAHYAAGMKTSIDCFEKRGKKGFLFTMGDEPNHTKITRSDMKRVFGIDSEVDLSAADCLAIAQRSYEVFHIVFTKVGVASHSLHRVMDSWTPLLGERVLKLDDHTKTAELVVSTLEVMAGKDKAAVAGSWAGGTAVTIANAIKDLTKTQATQAGLTRF